jgi:hypothetical protein
MGVSEEALTFDASDDCKQNNQQRNNDEKLQPK